MTIAKTNIMTVDIFLSKNQQLTKSDLANLLDISKNTVTKMTKQGSTIIQGLALEALHHRLRASNTIYVDCREWFDRINGNTYFTAWVNYKGNDYFLPFQYGYGSHVEDMAIKMLTNKGLIHCDKSQFILATDYNTPLHIEREECKKSELFKGNEYEQV